MRCVVAWCPWCGGEHLGSSWNWVRLWTTRVPSAGTLAPEALSGGRGAGGASGRRDHHSLLHRRHARLGVGEALGSDVQLHAEGVHVHGEQGQLRKERGRGIGGRKARSEQA